jgi:hypothetical protein
MNNNKYWLLFNGILGASGIFILYLITLLMWYTKHFINIFFLLPYIFIYVIFLNIGYLIVIKSEKFIKAFLGWDYDIRKVYIYMCVGMNLLLGIYMILEFSLFRKGHSSY